VNVPFFLQEKLVLPGQYMMGHILGNDLYNFIGKNELLISVRDLRFMLVSQERMRSGIKMEEVTPQLLLARLRENKFIGFKELLDRAQSFLPLMDKIPVLRFEELIAKDREKARPSINALAQVTECSPEEVFESRDKNIYSTAKNTSTGLSTYTGHFSEIDKVWTLEVEEAFISLGGDIINEQLGYSRFYTPPFN
jgi:hypothetical protein